MTNLYFPFDPLLTIRFAEGSTSSPSSSTSVVFEVDLEVLLSCAALASATAALASAAATAALASASITFFVGSSNFWAVIVDVAVLVSGLVGVGVSGANSTY